MENNQPTQKQQTIPYDSHEDGVITGADRRPSRIRLEQTAQSTLLVTLERLLTIETIDFKEALTQASDMIASALRADKVDVFLYDPAQEALIAMGVSQTSVGKHQQMLGLDNLLLINGGRTVLVYQTQQPFLTGYAELDPDQLVGIVEGLGIHSIISMPLFVKGELKGVLEAASQSHEAFSEYDLHFLEAVAGWIGIIMHRAELTTQVINEAKEEARQATAEELVTIIAHDLRNYFTVLSGRLGLIRRRALKGNNPEDLDNLDNIDKVFKNLNRMVNDLLDVGRLERGPFSLNKQPLELVSLIKEVAAPFNSPANPITVEAPPELYLEADDQRLRQLFENLLVNSLKFSPSGSPLDLSVSKEHHGKNSLARITLRDKGPGIDPAVLPQLFKRFVKMPGSVGLGLGLYLAQEIAQAHGGTLTAKSVQGEGTTFILFLPVPPVGNLDPG